jgi:hypothetical protein
LLKTTSQRYVINGPGWLPALAALVLADRFPRHHIAVAYDATGASQDLEPFIFDELSDDIKRIIADAVVRQWDDFVIAGSGQIKTVCKAAGLFDPAQLIVDAMRRLPSVPVEIAQTPQSSSVWIDLRTFAESCSYVHVFSTTNSRWVEWDGSLHLPCPVFADFDDGNLDWHRQYLPLAPNRILVRRVDHIATSRPLDFSQTPTDLATQYQRQYPSTLHYLEVLIVTLVDKLSAAGS